MSKTCRAATRGQDRLGEVADNSHELHTQKRRKVGQTIAERVGKEKLCGMATMRRREVATQCRVKLSTKAEGCTIGCMSQCTQCTLWKTSRGTQLTCLPGSSTTVNSSGQQASTMKSTSAEPFTQRSVAATTQLTHRVESVPKSVQWCAAKEPRSGKVAFVADLLGGSLPKQQRTGPDDVKTVRQRWRNLRDTLCKRNKELKKKSGSAAGDSKSSWPYFDLSFLRDVIEPSESSSNVATISTGAANFSADISETNSVNEVLLSYEEEASPHSPAQQVLLQMIIQEGRSSITQTTSSSPQSSLPLINLSNLSLCHSLASPQAISAALLKSPSQQPHASPSNGTKKAKNKRKSDVLDVAIENINKELNDKLDANEHFCLSLAKDINKIPEALQGYCKMHIMDIIMQYRAGKVPTTLMQLRQPDQ